MSKIWNILKYARRHIMTGVSFMVPVVVGAGLCQALGVIIGGPNVSQATGTFAYYLYYTGNYAMANMIVPVISAAMAYSMVDRPGIAPGLVVGLISINIKAGFLGGIVGAFVVGIVVTLIKEYVRLPKTMQGLMPILVIPFFGSAISGLIMFTVLGLPIVWIMEQLTTFLASLSTGAKFLYGFVMGAMDGVDYGGPIGKTVSLYSTGLMADGILEPKAAHMAACMTPPMGVLVAWFLSKVFRKPIFTRAEKENLKACFPMGVCMITECVIPIAMNDFVRVVTSTIIGSGVAGALSVVWNVGSPVAHGGWFVIPVMTNPLHMVAAIAIGSIVTGVLMVGLKKRLSENELDQENVIAEQGEAAEVTLEL